METLRRNRIQFVELVASSNTERNREIRKNPIKRFKLERGLFSHNLIEA